MNRFTGPILVVAALVPRFAVGQVCVKQISVPKYVPIALAARVTGDVSLKISIGAQGEVASVVGSGPSRMLVEGAKENVRGWIFCAPMKKRSSRVRLRYIYRLEGIPVYRITVPKVVIDLGAGTITITSAPPKIEPD